LAIDPNSLKEQITVFVRHVYDVVKSVRYPDIRHDLDLVQDKLICHAAPQFIPQILFISVFEAEGDAVPAYLLQLSAFSLVYIFKLSLKQVMSWCIARIWTSSELVRAIKESLLI
tara:strand:+ start:15694 stop:16038 length:345 start_codon:yes stop_codon:yes gene_type:complete